jgi:NADPH2:quinone reductase
MGNYIVEPEESSHYFKELFELIASGKLKLNINKTYPFNAEGCVQAQKDLTSGASVGKLLLSV